MNQNPSFFVETQCAVCQKYLARTKKETYSFSMGWKMYTKSMQIPRNYGGTGYFFYECNSCKSWFHSRCLQSSINSTHKTSGIKTKKTSIDISLNCPKCKSLIFSRVIILNSEQARFFENYFYFLYYLRSSGYFFADSSPIPREFKQMINGKERLEILSRRTKKSSLSREAITGLIQSISAGSTMILLQDLADALDMSKGNAIRLIFEVLGPKGIVSIQGDKVVFETGSSEVMDDAIDDLLGAYEKWSEEQEQKYKKI